MMFHPPIPQKPFTFLLLVLKTATILCCVAAFSAQPNIHGNAKNIGQSETIPGQLNIAFVTGNKMKVSGLLD
jgi:hypothetical protein